MTHYVSCGVLLNSIHSFTYCSVQQCASIIPQGGCKMFTRRRREPMRDFVVFRIPNRVCSLRGSRMLRSSSRFATVVTSTAVTQTLMNSIIYIYNKQKLTLSLSYVDIIFKQYVNMVSSFHKSDKTTAVFFLTAALL